MSVSKRPGWRRGYLHMATTLLCVGSHAVEAAPANNSSKRQPSSAAAAIKISPRASGSNLKKSPTTGAVAAPKQAAAPTRSTEQKTGERVQGNQSAWPPPPATRQFAPEPPVDTSIPPPSLPKASRARMRTCAEEWTKKKLLTRNDIPRWRDFATGCLSQKVKH